MHLEQRKHRLEQHLKARGLKVEWVSETCGIWDGGSASFNATCEDESKDLFHAPGMYSLYALFPLQGGAA